MRPQHFDFITTQIRNHSGISLSDDKLYLIESRLQPVARQHGYDDIDDMIAALGTQMNDAIMHDIVQSMTTNETMFFRDNKPFERLKDVILPHLRERDPKRTDIRIWSAACSSGQEPYTIALCLKEQQPADANHRYEILGTDLCEKAIAKARSATYSQFEVQRGMPIQMLVQYFEQQGGNQWQLKSEIREQVTFQTHNLLQTPKAFGQFDIVFCRNVLIYFDEDVKRKVMEHLVSALRAPGYVVLGSAETMMGINDKLVMLDGAPGVYTLK